MSAFRYGRPPLSPIKGILKTIVLRFLTIWHLQTIFDVIFAYFLGSGLGLGLKNCAPWQRQPCDAALWGLCFLVCVSNQLNSPAPSDAVGGSWHSGYNLSITLFFRITARCCLKRYTCLTTSVPKDPKLRREGALIYSYQRRNCGSAQDERLACDNNSMVDLLGAQRTFGESSPTASLCSWNGKHADN